MDHLTRPKKDNVNNTYQPEIKNIKDLKFQLKIPSQLLQTWLQRILDLKKK